MVCRWFASVLASLRLVIASLGCGILSRHGSAFQKIRQTTPVRRLPALLISVRHYFLARERVALGAGAAAGASSIRLTNRVGLVLPGRK